MMTYLYRTSILKFTIAFLALVSLVKSVSGDAKKSNLLRFIHNNYNNHFHDLLHQTGFLRVYRSECYH